MSRESAMVLALAIAATLWAPPATSAPRSQKDVLDATRPAVVMVMAVDVDRGRLVPIASGSGTIVDPNGSILTNHHILFDADAGRLHDLFVIGRFRAVDRAPEIVCAGSPRRARLEPEIDLALIRCDLDMDGQPFVPRGWPSLPMRRLDRDDLVPGEQVWVLGYPNVGAGAVHVTDGLVSGWTSASGGAGRRDFIKTDAQITHGNSGGTAIDEDGNFIGVPTAFRVTHAALGQTVITAGSVGLIRPLSHARELIAEARSGKALGGGGGDPGPVGGPGPPAPTAPLPPPTPTGVSLTGTVVDAANGRPVAGAVVIVLRPGVDVSDLDPAELETEALAWAETDAAGVFRTDGELPRGARLSVTVLASGYRPLTQDGGLTIAADAPDLVAPWDRVRIRHR